MKVLHPQPMGYNPVNMKETWVPMVGCPFCWPLAWHHSTKCFQPGNVEVVKLLPEMGKGLKFQVITCPPIFQFHIYLEPRSQLPIHQVTMTPGSKYDVNTEAMFCVSVQIALLVNRGMQQIPPIRIRHPPFGIGQSQKFPC